MKVDRKKRLIKQDPEPTVPLMSRLPQAFGRRVPKQLNQTVRSPSVWSWIGKRLGIR